MKEAYSEIFKERFGKLLDVCKENDIQQQDIAKALGVSKQTLTAWKTGDRSPRMPMIKQMAEYFHVPIGYFTGGADDSLPGQMSILDEFGLSADDVQTVDASKAQARKSAKRVQLENLIESATDDQLDLLIGIAEAVIKNRKG